MSWRHCSWLLVLCLSGCAIPTRFTTAPVPVAQQQDHDAIMGLYGQYRGAPYRLGGTSKSGLDCSAFVQKVYQGVYQHPLPRTTSQQVSLGRPVSPAELAVGDLVFFKTGWNERHVGVYVGHGDFIHASSSVGVTRSSLNGPYWAEKFWGARRII